MKPDTKGYSRLPILNSTIIFLNFVPKISFSRKFGPKTSMQSALFRMKIHTKSIQRCWFWILQLFPEVPLLTTLFGKIWSQNFKVLYLKWIFVQRGLQGCWFQSIQKVVGISTSQYLFVCIFILNKPLWRFRTKSTRKRYFRDKS